MSALAWKQTGGSRWELHDDTGRVRAALHLPWSGDGEVDAAAGALVVEVAPWSGYPVEVRDEAGHTLAIARWRQWGAADVLDADARPLEWRPATWLGGAWELAHAGDVVARVAMRGAWRLGAEVETTLDPERPRDLALLALTWAALVQTLRMSAAIVG